MARDRRCNEDLVIGERDRDPAGNHSRECRRADCNCDMLDANETCKMCGVVGNLYSWWGPVATAIFADAAGNAGYDVWEDGKYCAQCAFGNIMYPGAKDGKMCTQCTTECNLGWVCSACGLKYCDEDVGTNPSLRRGKDGGPEEFGDRCESCTVNVDDWNEQCSMPACEREGRLWEDSNGVTHCATCAAKQGLLELNGRHVSGPTPTFTSSATSPHLEPRQVVREGACIHAPSTTLCENDQRATTMAVCDKDAATPSNQSSTSSFVSALFDDSDFDDSDFA